MFLKHRHFHSEYHVSSSFFFLNISFHSLLFIYFYFWMHWVFISVHGLSLVVVCVGYSLVTVCGLLLVVVSPVTEHRL